MKMKSFLLMTSVLILVSQIWDQRSHAGSAPFPGYAGSASCKECHEKFHQLWSTSWHGLAMRPYTAEFARKELTPQKEDIVIGKYRYRADIGPDGGYIEETGPEGTKKHRMEHVLGGKGLYYFLTMLEKGHLQSLPVAYDVIKKEWYNAVASEVPNFQDSSKKDAPKKDEIFDWKARPYMFDTACPSCHVSQFKISYDLETSMYSTAWTEPGINCETCHGPGEEHVRIAQKTPKGQPLPELKIIRTKTMTTEQRNYLCAPCHAKRNPLTTSYRPGERFFDNFDLVGMENPDFYPDGRDLGENYTYTSWLMSPCAKSGKIDCMHCHTSSGRYRFREEEKANDACTPCHAEHVKNPAGHSHHRADSPGSKCVSCHMPVTSFARMKRSDHSMLPPTPAATVAFKSPNACNICHTDKDAAWADRRVRKWYKRDYQAPVLKRAGFVAAARKRDWKRLPEMLEYIQSKDRDEVFAASLIRLLRESRDERVYPVLLKAIKDPSPLVRSAAAEAVGFKPSPVTAQALLQAAGDDYRVVRIRAAAGLTGYPKEMLKADSAKNFEKMNEEYLAFLKVRPDWSSHYNLGNYRLSRSEFKEAVASFQTALRIDPRAFPAMVSLYLAYVRLGETDKAEQALAEALKIAPDNGAANFFMGQLKSGQNDLAQAEKYFRNAFKADPRMDQAAYQLCLITAKDRLEEAVTWCRKAAELNPQDPRYAYTLALYQDQSGSTASAIKTLEELMHKHPAHADSYLLLGGIYEKHGKKKEAASVYLKAMTAASIPMYFRSRIQARLEALRGKTDAKKQ